MASPSLSKPPKRFGGLLQAFTPNRVLSPVTMKIIIAIQLAIFLVVWSVSPFKILPRPSETLGAFQELWAKHGLGSELLTSFQLNLTALGISALISLGLAYTTVMPFFRPLVSALSKGRFLSLVGFSLLFTVTLGDGHKVKLALLVFGMTVFFLTSMASVVEEIPKSEFDYARTLRMSEWRVVWEVVIIGTFDRALEVTRQNAAIGWMMLTMVEGISRSEGGIGVLLLNQQKYMKLSEVAAIQITILLIALFQDVAIGFLRKFLCPYVFYAKERA